MVNIEVAGLAALQNRMKALAPAIQKKVLRGMVASGAAIFKNEAIRFAPYWHGDVQKGHPPPGTLQESIYQFRIPEECVGTVEAWRVSVRKGTKAKGGVDAYYATWVEYGTVKMAPHPYMRPAFETKKEEVTTVMREYMAAHLPEAVESVK